MAQASGKSTGDEPITIKKYANRRLYNTATSSYVTLDHLCQMVKDGVDFVVYDAKSGDDITHSVLTQIIVEEESKGTNLLPISFLRQLIAFYGDNMQWMVPSYLEHAMQQFSRNQDQMRNYMRDTFGNMFPFSGNLEEVSKQNVAMFERAVKMLNPFGAEAEEAGGVAQTDQAGPAGQAARPAAPSSAPSSATTDGDESIDALKHQVENLQRQIDALKNHRGS